MVEQTHYRLAIPTMDWAEIRQFIVRRKWLRVELEPEIYDCICAGTTNYLPVSLMREISVYIAGYQRKGGSTLKHERDRAKDERHGNV